jgi:tRNA A37 threonylcarbamoyladenosine dehydratase
MDRLDLTRQADIIPEHILKKQITIVGAGAVGSFTTLALAKI